MSRRDFRLESKAAAVRIALAHAEGWHPKIARERAIRNWKARKGNLAGRPHPSEGLSWEAWRSITAARYRRLLEWNAALLECRP